MKKTASIIITLGLIIGIGIIFFGKTEKTAVPNVEIKDGIQYVTITAKSGYSPAVSTAQAGIPTKLIVSTKGTYDCSAALVIRSIDYQKVLPQSGTTEIDIGTPVAGVPLHGLCSMGMYNFQINFN